MRGDGMVHYTVNDGQYEDTAYCQAKGADRRGA